MENNLPHRARVPLRPRVEEQAGLRIETEGVLDLGRGGEGAGHLVLGGEELAVFHVLSKQRRALRKHERRCRSCEMGNALNLNQDSAESGRAYAADRAPPEYS